MPSGRKLRLVQLPVPPPAALAATGNVPLAAGCLGVAAQVHGLGPRLDLEVVEPAITDSLGDGLLADLIARDEPEFVGFSLYLWNVERSLHLAREVKRRSPRTTILVGGPEVGPDNPFVLGQRGFDIAVTGEAEDTFAALMDRLLDGRDPAGLPGVAVRKPLGLSAFGPQANASFPLTDYPSPYLEGLVPVDPQRSTYVETVRGCRSHCTFCFYPRSSSVLRTLDVAQSGSLISALREKGARDLSFLDPTFNHRPGFEELVEAIGRANPGRTMSFFAEVRAEGLTPAHAQSMAKAGFTRLEIGLQSVNRETLKRVKRGGSPEKVAGAARMLHDAGIELLVDLIIGLPGDTADDVARGVDFLLENGLGDEAQVFPLSLLPGTAMRATAAEDGVEFDEAPPYRVKRTATMTGEQMLRALLDAEERLGRRLDERPRPHLCAVDPAARARDVLQIDLDDLTSGTSAALRAPAARHLALWLTAGDLWDRRAAALDAVDIRITADPFTTLDVVLAARAPFPLDLLDAIEAKLSAAPPSYLSRALAHRGENLMRRLCVVLPAGVSLPPDWIEAIRSRVPVFREQTIAEALVHAEDLGIDRPSARILDRGDARSRAQLSERADAEAVGFADRALEQQWQRGVLGFGDGL